MKVLPSLYMGSQIFKPIYPYETSIYKNDSYHHGDNYHFILAGTSKHKMCNRINPGAKLA